MKRRTVLFLLLVLLGAAALAGCRKAPDAEADGRTVVFYYRTPEIYYGTDGGVLMGERRSIAEDAGIAQILSDYLAGPLSEAYLSPFPEGVGVESVSQNGNTVSVTVSSEYGSLGALDRAIADACLTRTATELTGAESLALQIDGESETRAHLHGADDYQWYDMGVEDQRTPMRLYFASAKNRYLLAETRKTEAKEGEHLASEIVNQLIAGPSGISDYATMPEGTKLQNLQIENGVCTVDFSVEFVLNRPQDELSERMTVYSIVNSLTELPGVDAVSICVNGAAIPCYLYLDLSQPISRYEAVIGPVRQGLNEFDATIYLLQEGESRLFQIPVAVRQPASKTQLEAIVEALLKYTPPTGFYNPIPEGTKLRSLTLVDGTCYLDFSANILKTGGTLAQDAACVRTIVATLCARPEVDEVQILVNGEAKGFSYDISAPLHTIRKWFQ